MMANFTAASWSELLNIFPGRILKGERGTNAIHSPGWNLFEAGNTVTGEELELIERTPGF